METKEFLLQENYMLRREMEKQASRLEIYEDIIFNILNIKFKFELMDEISDDPQIMIHIWLPSTELQIKKSLEEIKELMLLSLK